MGSPGDGEADMRAGVVPGDGADECVVDEPKGEVFSGVEFCDSAVFGRGFGGGAVEEEACGGFGGLEAEGD